MPIRINIAETDTDKRDALELLLWRDPVWDIPSFDFDEIAKAIGEQGPRQSRIAAKKK